MAELPRSAEVVVIGGGAVGTSIAYQLGRRGVRDVVVIERDTLGAGSTSKAAGGIRCQFPLPIEVQFSLYSLDFYRHFEDELGADPEFRAEGYLFLISDPGTLPRYRAAWEMQRELGAHVDWLEGDELHRFIPGLETDGVLAATSSPEDGYAGPNEVVQAYAAGARGLGATMVEQVQVTGITVNGGRVTGVSTSAGEVSTPVIVNAAGPWAAPVARLAGIELPVHPRRRHIFVTEPFTEVRHPLPLIIDRSSGFYFRSELRSVLMSAGDVGPVDEFEVPPIDWSMMEVAVERAVRWMPALEHARIRNAWVGLRPLTPDEHAIIDFAPGIDGLLMAVGFCGHGFQHSPAAGKAVAELILDGRSSFDLSALRLDRFPAGAALEHAGVHEAD
jgi:sarcosine oxidase, subunit beta